MDKPLTLLNNLSPSEFLTEYWQKKPLLIRQAISNFTGLLTPNELAGLACEEDVESRLIQHQGQKWHVENGPFKEADFNHLPNQDWTLLVQNVNHFLPEATALLQRFNFIPYARLDDLMVSYAPIGGSVGAHMDSYDVFLLQGNGKRRWQISSQSDLSLVENAPIKLLKHFEAEQTWTLEAGDMLYLPPSMAHHGISESDDCMTYSIGFRAPSSLELIQGLAEFMQNTMQGTAHYADANLTLQNHPAEISPAMVENVSNLLRNIEWHQEAIGEFLGHYLSEPKPHVLFDTPENISEQAFSEAIANNSVELDLKSQLLFYQSQFYLNGETLTVPKALRHALRTLADARKFATNALDSAQCRALAICLYPAYCAGYIHLHNEPIEAR